MYNIQRFCQFNDINSLQTGSPSEAASCAATQEILTIDGTRKLITVLTRALLLIPVIF
jgi:hypothetical protein